MVRMWITGYMWMLALVTIWALLVLWRRRRLRAMAREPSRNDVAIDALPKFAYVEGEELTAAKCKGVEDCAICLGLFLQGDTLRLMPGCSHVFHADCVDRWLSCHPTCPFCRASLFRHSAQPEPCRDDPIRLPDV